MSYVILLTNDNDYRVIVLSCSYERLSDFFDAIQKSLHEIKFKGAVLLDYFGCNGNTSNRFAEIYFDGEQLLRASWKRPSSIPMSCIKECNTYFKSHWPQLSAKVVSSRLPA